MAMPLRRESAGARQPFALATPAGELTVLLRVSDRAFLPNLRSCPEAGGIELVVPRGMPLAKAEAFARRHYRWIARHLRRLPARVPFADGALLPLHGVDHRIRHRPETRGVVWVEDGTIHVAGAAEHLARRLGDWLRGQARRALTERTLDKAMAIARDVRRVSVRDSVSQWGSCSPEGALSYSWRLILAPDAVLDYVVAHEVAHLVYRGHGPRFWRLCERLTAAAGPARRWLSDHGASLHRYG